MDLVDRLRRGPPTGPAPDPAALAAAAEAAELLDVAYATLDAPVGPLLVAATPRGVVRIAYADAGEGPLLEELAVAISPRLLRAPRRVDPARRQLDEYFAGRRRRFELELDLSLVRGFGRRVLEVASRLGFGEVATYAQIAAAAGSPRGARAAGNALGRNPIPIVVPCHRVLHAGGGLGGYTGGLDRKRLLLGLEREGRLPLVPGDVA
jgi:methylated-DNA-[protein]-cysteine S-methyltransferase